MGLNDYEKKKLKETLSYIRRDIENNTRLSQIGPYREDLNWLLHKIPYPKTVPLDQGYEIRNIFYLNPKNKHKCLFLEIEDYNSNFEDFFLSLNNPEKTGQLCPICGSLSCTVQMETYPDTPKKAFLTAQCNNPQCRAVGQKIHELEYRNELEKLCAKEEKSSRLHFLKELLKPLSILSC
jgi:hypothetical protein